jgi:hypothetical protein
VTMRSEGKFGVRIMLLALSLVMCGSCGHGQTRCPWLNVATASGVLDGPVVLTVENPAVNETTCVFRYQTAKTVEELQVDVRLRQDAGKGIVPEQSTCTGPGTPVRAIGNEAILCVTDTRGSRGDEVIGRVRDSVFRGVISTTAKNDVALTRDVLEQKAKDTAEQIAGALF